MVLCIKQKQNHEWKEYLLLMKSGMFINVKTVADDDFFVPTDPATVSTMEPSVYNAAKEGNVGYIIRRFENGDRLAAFLTPQDDTVLHVAAYFGQTEVVREVIRLEPALLLVPNANGDTPLHIAAGAENATLLPLLIRHYQTDIESEYSSSDAAWRSANSEGDTALHVAIRNKCVKNALQLLEDHRLVGCVNNAEESPLYLAASLGLYEVAMRIIDIGSSGRDVSVQGPNGQTPLHAAASRRATDIARLLSTKVPGIVRVRDNFGRTALHHCVSRSATETATMLLEADYKLAYIADEDGLTPLLTATSFNLWNMVDIILRHCPDCAQIRDNRGQNVLHVAMRERLRPMHVINHAEVRRLLNDADHDGNTPLHIAIMSSFYLGAVRLLGCHDINPRARNKAGFTALDLLEISKPFSVQHHRNMVKLMLGRDAVRSGKNLGRDPFIDDELPDLKEAKEWANTLVVVATLVCTISATAAFTFPGGYDSANGTPLLGTKVAFYIFYMADAAAFVASISSAYMLVWGLHWGTLGEPRHLYAGVKYSHAFLNYAFTATVGMFIAGVFLVTVDKCKWVTALIALACFQLFAVSTHPFIATLADLPRYWVWLYFEFMPARGDPTSSSRSSILARDVWEDWIEELCVTWRYWFPDFRRLLDFPGRFTKKETNMH